MIKNHVIVGVSGDDLDIPGYLESHDPETGELQWRWYGVPKPGEPGSETWPNAEAMAHGGGMTWVPSTYDPDLNMLFCRHRQPAACHRRKRPQGQQSFTESIVALNLDTGKLVWHFQPSPHDTHDWDAVQTPVLIDGEIDGQPRKLVAQASRNGWFFVLDRKTGKNFIIVRVRENELGKRRRRQGSAHPESRQGAADRWRARLARTRAARRTGRLPASARRPDLFYVNATRAYSIYYIFDDDEKPEGWGGNDQGGWGEAMLQAIDYKTGKIRWSHKWEGSSSRGGVLSTAGNLVFAGDPDNNLVALNATTGQPLWHANLGSDVSNGPITYELGGAQYLVVAAGDTLYAFVLHGK